MAQFPKVGGGWLSELENSGLHLDKLSITDASSVCGARNSLFALTAENGAFLGRLIGHVKHLVIGQGISGIENALLHLKSVETLELVDPRSGDWTVDDLFCGIHPEEVEVLKRKDVQYLKAVHIVPVWPSILHVNSKLF